MKSVGPVKSKAEVTLPQTAYLILGLLSFGQELSGYDIRSWAATALVDIQPVPAQSHTYSELRRLTRLGYVRERHIEQTDRPNKRTYRLTSAGRDQLRAWVKGRAAQPVRIKHPTALRVMFGHVARDQDLARLLDEYVAATDERIARLEELAAGIGPEPSAGIAPYVTQWIRDVLIADARGAELVRRALDEEFGPSSLPSTASDDSRQHPTSRPPNRG